MEAATECDSDAHTDPWGGRRGLAREVKGSRPWSWKAGVYGDRLAGVARQRGDFGRRLGGWAVFGGCRGDHDHDHCHDHCHDHDHNHDHDDDGSADRCTRKARGPASDWTQCVSGDPWGGLLSVARGGREVVLRGRGRSPGRRVGFLESL